MKRYLERELLKLGYSDFEWCLGRLGYYLLATRYGVRTCIDLRDLVNNLIESNR